MEDYDDDETLLSLLASGAVTPCCIEMKGTMVRRDLIKRYYIQDTAMCNIKAVT